MDYQNVKVSYKILCFKGLFYFVKIVILVYSYQLLIDQTASAANTFFFIVEL